MSAALPQMCRLLALVCAASLLALAAGGIFLQMAIRRHVHATKSSKETLSGNITTEQHRNILPDTDTKSRFESVVHPCKFNGALNDFDCECSARFQGKSCEKLRFCDTGPCLHNSTCYYDRRADDYSCHCAEGATGHNCAMDTNECVSAPCQHGGTCQDVFNGYTCDCVVGYTGRHCDSDHDECASAPCQHHGLCADRFAGYRCMCYGGYHGAQCQRPGACPAGRRAVDWLAEVWSLRPREHSMYVYPNVIGLSVLSPFILTVYAEAGEHRVSVTLHRVAPAARRPALLYRLRTLGGQQKHGQVQVTSSPAHGRFYMLQNTTLCVFTVRPVTHRCSPLRLGQYLVKSNKPQSSQGNLRIKGLFSVHRNLLLYTDTYKVVFILHGANMTNVTPFRVEHAVLSIQAHVTPREPLRYLVVMLHTQRSWPGTQTLTFAFHDESGELNRTLQRGDVMIKGEEVEAADADRCGGVLAVSLMPRGSCYKRTEELPGLILTLYPHGGWVRGQGSHERVLWLLRLKAMPCLLWRNMAFAQFSRRDDTVYLVTGNGHVLVYRDVFSNVSHWNVDDRKWHHALPNTAGPVDTNRSLGVTSSCFNVSTSSNRLLHVNSSSTTLFLGALRRRMTLGRRMSGVVSITLIGEVMYVLQITGSDVSRIHLYSRDWKFGNIIRTWLNVRGLQYDPCQNRLLYVVARPCVGNVGWRKPAICAKNSVIMSADRHGFGAVLLHKVPSAMVRSTYFRDMSIIVSKQSVLVVTVYRDHIVVKPLGSGAYRDEPSTPGSDGETRAGEVVTLLASCGGADGARLYVYRQNRTRQRVTVTEVSAQGRVTAQRTVYTLTQPLEHVRAACDTDQSCFLIERYAHAKVNKHWSVLKRVFHNNTYVILKRLYSYKDVTFISKIFSQLVVVQGDMYVFPLTEGGDLCRQFHTHSGQHRCEVCSRGWTGRRCESALSSCQAQPCHTHHTRHCEEVDPRTRRCHCKQGHYGERCEHTSDCGAADPCQNANT